MQFHFLAKETGGCEARAGPNKLSIAASGKLNGSLDFKLVLETSLKSEASAVRCDTGHNFKYWYSCTCSSSKTARKPFASINYIGRLVDPVR